MKKTLTLSTALLLTLHAFSQNFYVNGASGNNSNNGTSPATAWKTIQKSMDAATPGSTVFIKGGTYKEQLNLHVSGTAGNPITFTAQPDETVIIDGNNQKVTLLYIENRNYFNITGLVFQNTLGNGSAGVIITGASGDFKFNRNIIQGVKWTASAATIPGFDDNCNPFVVYGNALTSIKNIVIDSNEIRNNINGFSENLTLDGNVELFTISNNLVHNNTNIGIDCAGNFKVCSDPALDQARNGVVLNNRCYNNVSSYATSAGIYVDGGKDIVIERNICYGNGWGIEIGAEENGTVSNIVVRNNLLYHNRDAGLAFGGYTTQTTGQVINSSFTNNTLFANDLGENGNGEVYITKASNCVFKNNIIRCGNQNVMLTRIQIAPQSNNTFAYNCWNSAANTPNTIEVNWGNSSLTGFAAFKSAMGDTHAIFSDPSFVNTGATPDLHISNGSICRDAGDPNFVAANGEKDLDGKPRVSNNHVDMGAYEVQMLAGTHAADDPDLQITLFPNPVSGRLYFKTTETVQRILLKNSTGQTLGIWQSPRESIDVSGVDAGIYFVEIQCDKNTSLLRKIVVYN